MGPILKMSCGGAVRLLVSIDAWVVPKIEELQGAWACNVELSLRDTVLR